ncbi:uncharacterized protein LOC107989250 [Cynoglossus semilaevis]|uniref:uncharacterized protein LOC107989250 n=1 Tax=Cynoglossus semilaevis TaxID=244447 RepID=UPI0007DC89FF|nr:uncharacterized protein LOC107989250 [Cynoglossus semilaevis]
MLTMKGLEGILLLCLGFVSSSYGLCSNTSCGEHFYSCDTSTLSAPLGSSVLLPCTFTTSSHTVVEWKHTAGGNLLRLMPNGQVTFLLPRGGRVKVFPNQSSRGNYSVRIDELLTSDLGCYCCVMGEMSNCHQVEMVVATDTLMKTKWLLISICVGVTSFITLSICSYFLYRSRTKNSRVICTDGWELPVQPHRTAAGNQQKGVDNDLVYENDDQAAARHTGDPTTSAYPGQHPGQTRRSAQRTRVYQNLEPELNFKQRFHIELFNRLRNASRRYYVNQSEFQRQGRAQQRRQDYYFPNPVYEKRTQQSHHL